ncbi:MAG: isoprenylcysteine carboxylmethyltransferase family protein [Cyclobacteriaceae bacterium]|nr:isoprenylcysteine carboxylmethyltransferase family protein [Cyclobacteriaceae bacterium]
MTYGVLIVGWIVYLGLHSVLASATVKEISARWLGSYHRFYRLGYSIFSTVGLVALLVVNGSIAAPYYFEPMGIPRFISLVLTTVGVIVMQLAFRNYRLKAFLGFEEEESRLRTGGVLSRVRHPIYSGLILVTVGFFVFIPNLPTLITCASILLYLPIGIYLEEKKLIREFGDAYLKYRKEVPALIPRRNRLAA